LKPFRLLGKKRDEAFLPAERLRLKKAGNPNNFFDDFGDKEFLIHASLKWCSSLKGLNVNNHR